MTQSAPSGAADLSRLRRDFPILSRSLDGKPLVYLDSAATSLKPQPVIDAVTRFYTEYTANVHRAVHQLSEEATEAFEAARARIARFINAESREIAFVRNATEAINVVAMSLYSWARGSHGQPDRRDAGPTIAGPTIAGPTIAGPTIAGPTSVVMVPLTEHHSNLLPWRGGRVEYLDVLATGEIDLEAARRKIAAVRPTLLALSTLSNALGVRAPVAELTAMAREVGARVLLDLSQTVGHEPVDVRALGCDFACFSGHKMLGPSGIGVLYQREGQTECVKPVLVGGSMVQQVHVDSAEYQPFPWCLEAGTPHIEGVLGLAAACDYLDAAGLDVVHAHCQNLCEAARRGLARMERVRLLGATQRPAESIVSFTVDGVTAHGVARIMSNRHGIMIRSGYHCAQPMHEAMKLGESARLSVHLYNTMDEIETFLRAAAAVTRI